MHKNAVDLTGQKFGRLTALNRTTEVGNRHGVNWVCRCECGSIKKVRASSLRNGQTRSCGCLQREAVSEGMKRYHREQKLAYGEDAQTQRLWGDLYA